MRAALLTPLVWLFLMRALERVEGWMNAPLDPAPQPEISPLTVLLATPEPAVAAPPATPATTARSEVGVPST